MGRGQYDRAAARAKREGNHFMSQEEVVAEIVRPLTAAFNEDQKRFREAQIRDAKRTEQQLDHMMDTHLRVADVQQPQFARPGFPYENIVTPILNPHGQPITQADYDALVAKSDRLLRLCQTHGLMI